MITRDKYLEALRIVEEYHDNIKLKSSWVLMNELNSFEDKRVIVDDWIDAVGSGRMPARVYRALTARKNDDLRGVKLGDRYFTYMDEVTKDKFVSIRNVGVRAWNNFEYLLKKTSKI